MHSIRFGVDRLIDRSIEIEGDRLGILTNDAARSCASPSVPARVALVKGGTPIVRVFSPEHGIGALAADGTAVDDSVDARTGLPVVSLYGERLAPTLDSIADLDAVLFDVPDAGARFYTYLWSLTHLIDTCARADVEVIVLDRPNPHSGDLARAEGPLLDLQCCASFLGRLDIPITHGLTLGELARLWKAERRPEARLKVVPMTGWRRSMTWQQTGCRFVAPSPALRSAASVALYPGLCLFEAFNVSVGRGSDLSFESIGAPWLDPDAVIEHLEQDALEGVRFETASYTPSIRPYAGEACRAVRIDVTDAQRLRPVMLGMHLVRAVHRAHSEDLLSAPYPTVANPSGEAHLALLIGRREVAERLQSATVEDIRGWTRSDGWAERVAPHLLYDL